MSMVKDQIRTTPLIKPEDITFEAFPELLGQPFLNEEDLDKVATAEILNYHGDRIGVLKTEDSFVPTHGIYKEVRKRPQIVNSSITFLRVLGVANGWSEEAFTCIWKHNKSKSLCGGRKGQLCHYSSRWLKYDNDKKIINEYYVPIKTLEKMIKIAKEHLT